MDTIAITLTNGSTIAAAGINMLELNHELGRLTAHWQLIAADLAPVLGEDSAGHQIAIEAADRAYTVAVHLWCVTPLPDYATRSEAQVNNAKNRDHKISDECAGHSG
jgi:hypothetical protein